MSLEADPVIRIAAALIIDGQGRTLLVRKRGTQAFMQAGGKIEGGESAADALIRELHEELGLELDAAAPEYLGRFVAPAANEPGRLVEAEMFRVTTDQAVRPAAEIDEVVWIRPSEPGDLPLAPLTRDHVLPICAAKAS